MKSKTARRSKINVITLGCSKNIVDSEVLMGQLKANKLDVTHESDEPTETVVINTCGFIENAKQESLDTILKYAAAKEAGLVKKVYVTGCLSERYKDDLIDQIPDIDEYFGTHDLPRLLKVLGADYKHELVGERLLTTPVHYAYLKIAEGCDRPCSFCAIPIMRGKHVSKPIEVLVAQAENLAKNGTKELILIAQDLTYYGLDIYKERKLATLLEKLSEVKGIEWIRLHYAFPSGFPADVLQVIREKENICNYIDIPLQHASDSMLKSMRRGITAKKTEELLSTFRKEVPGIAIRTTLICGYPGETEKDFEELKAFVRKYRFDRLGVFAYSHEEDTHAFKLADDVPEEAKQQRIDEIMEIQQGISLALNQAKVGKTFKVLIDRKEGDYFIGRTEHDSPEVDNEVLINGTDQYLRIGDFANIEITGAEDYDLHGRIAEKK
ncbi:MAG TPA: 30S ribosomal protein S12 methylthiotransferase RimO [Flavobacteriales bacterium]|nr:30S ribosomal protein S12 methylthiotransferase RimO [Flavobacteriales bacterium]